MKTENVIKKLEQVAEALKIEKQEEAEAYSRMLQQTSLSQRVTQGFTWFPLNIEQTGFGLGEYPFAIVSRTKNLDKPHSFRSGQPVTVFVNVSREDNAKREASVTGVIDWIDKAKMKIVFYADEHPDFLNDGSVGVEPAFDERSFKEMEKALQKVIKAEKNRLAELRDIIYGVKPPSFKHHNFEGGKQIAYLNESQSKVVRYIGATEDIALVHGPPGTGKTTTLVQAIIEMLPQEKPILVCAASNTAVDLLAERLSLNNVNVVRIGNLSRIDENILPLSLDARLSARPEMYEVKKLRQEADKLFKKAGKWKRSFDAQSRIERQETRNEAKAILAHARMLEDYVIQKLITSADVICTTLTGSNDRYIEKMMFQTVVIDEASQALEPAMWIAIAKANRVIMAGDPYQLPPTVKSNDAVKAGLAVTLMEKCIPMISDNGFLNIQYRMHEMIMGFSNRMFYDNKLTAADFVRFRTLVLEGGDPHPIEFFDTAGCGFEEKIHPETQSRFNPEEYNILRLHLDNLLCYTGDRKYSIAIISPYREQVEYIKEHIKEDFNHFPDANIEVDTIDAFQGQESDIVYISLVRSNENSEIGFLSDTRRMNVALTRAKMKLVLIGDSATFGVHQFFSALLQYIESTDSYHTAWEWM